MDPKLPATWTPSTLGAVAHCFLSGGTPSTKNDAFWRGLVPWITSKWLNARLYLDSGEKFISDEAVRQSATTVVPRNNLIFATRAGVGKVAVNRLDLAINQDLAGVLIDSERYDIRFIAYQLRSERVQNVVSSHKRGATIQGITRDNLKELEINLPPLAEQRKIAGLLGLVQRALEQQERLIALTTELKKALLHQLFTQGLRGEPQKQTDIGPVPQSWEVVKLGEYLTEAQYGISVNDVWTKLNLTQRGRTARATETGDVRCLRRGRRHGESHHDGRSVVHAAAKKLSGMKTWRDKQEFKARVLEWAHKLDVKAHSLAVRPMRRKWASCSTAGNLNFNMDLLGLDRELGDYVIVHELLHFSVPNHGKLWKSLMRGHLGDYEKVNERLKQLTLLSFQHRQKKNPGLFRAPAL